MIRHFTRQIKEARDLEQRLDVRGISVSRLRMVHLNTLLKSFKTSNVLKYIVDFGLFVGPDSAAEALEKVIHPINGSPTMINSGATFSPTGKKAGFEGDGAAAYIDTLFMPYRDLDINSYTFVVLGYHNANSGTIISDSINKINYAGFGTFFNLTINGGTFSSDLTADRSFIITGTYRFRDVYRLNKKIINGGSGSQNSGTISYSKNNAFPQNVKLFLLADTDASNNLSAYSPADNTIKCYIVLKNIPMSIAGASIVSAFQNPLTNYMAQFGA
jgi:hypothetical protein